MVCHALKPRYIPHSNKGLKVVSSENDGTICIEWTKAYPSDHNDQIAYNIYYSTNFTDVYSEGVKFVSVEDGYLNGCLDGLTPGDVLYFAVKATEYNLTWYNLGLLPAGNDDGLRIYPEGGLLEDITDSSMILKVSGIDQFPAYGVVQVGIELIRYSNKDLVNSELIVAERGFFNTSVTLHNTDGYDGIKFRDPIIRFFKGFEDDNEVIIQGTSKFIYPNYAFTEKDGYATQTDLLTTNLTASDQTSKDFPSYDYAGWHRTDPVALLQGECVGSYYGGYDFCADDSTGVGRQIRGVPFQAQSQRRLEMLLRIDGEPCVLLRRLWSGIKCKCVYNTQEYPEYSCEKCYGTGINSGFQQVYNERRSDRRIMVRFDPTVDDLKMEDAGLESDFAPTCWTLVYPTLKDKDVLIRFNQDGTEEFRYEVLNVTRNKLLQSLSGAQKFAVKRIRKTDPVYMFRTIRDASTMPTEIHTSIAFVRGPNGLMIPHKHVIFVDEHITSISQINSTTSYDQLHSHSMISGVLQEELGHSHDIIFP